MRARFHVRLALAGWLAAGAAACGPHVDLAASLEVTDVSSGYLDNGIKDGAHHLLPTVRFKIRNAADVEVNGLQVTVQFWKEGDLGEFDSRLLSPLTIPPGTETDEKFVRTEMGYTLENPNIGELFEHYLYKDFTVRFFARRSGQIVQIGEFPVERRILTNASSAGRP
jgi:hypothetical protein